MMHAEHSLATIPPHSSQCALVLSLSLSLMRKHLQYSSVAGGPAAQVVVALYLQCTMHVSLEGLSAPGLRADTQVL